MSLPLLVIVFLGAAGAVWLAGVQLSKATDVLDRRLGIGEAIGASGCRGRCRASRRTGNAFLPVLFVMASVLTARPSSRRRRRPIST